MSKTKFTHRFQWSQAAVQIWCCGTRHWILFLKNPKDTADGCSLTPLLPQNSYYIDRTHKYSIYKILLQDLHFSRGLLEVHRKHWPYVTPMQMWHTVCFFFFFFSHRKINTKSTAFSYKVHCGTCTSAKRSGNQKFLNLTIFSCCQGNTVCIFLQLKKKKCSFCVLNTKYIK